MLCTALHCTALQSMHRMQEYVLDFPVQQFRTWRYDL